MHTIQSPDGEVLATFDGLVPRTGENVCVPSPHTAVGQMPVFTVRDVTWMLTAHGSAQAVITVVPKGAMLNG